MIRRRQTRELPHVLFLLAMHVQNLRFHKLPAVTLIVAIAQILLYAGVIQVPWNAEDVCISAKKIIKYKDWRSFFFSNFEHGSDMHLYHNMLSFILTGSYLESIYGVNFIFLVIILSIGCSAMYVFLGYTLMQLTGDYGHFIACAIGFSGTLFALKVISLSEEHNRPDGFTAPIKLAMWLELISLQLFVPNSSFIGHLGGILVGSLYSYTFVGEKIDNLIYAITGTPIIHEEQFYRRRNRLFNIF